MRSVGVSVGYTTAPTAATDTAPARDATSAWGVPKGVAGSTPTGSAGIGSYSGNNKNGTTKSGISGIAGAQGVRTGDGRSAGTLVKDWNTQTNIKGVQAQAQLTQQFNQNAAREIGTYAGKQAADLRAQAKSGMHLEKQPDRNQLTKKPLEFPFEIGRWAGSCEAHKQVC